MRNPVRSEADAFHIVVGSGVVALAAVALGALVDPLVGVALVVGAVVGALIWEIATPDPDPRQPLRDAIALGRAQPREGRRVLVVANRTLASAALRDEIARCGREGADIHVVAPILASRAHYFASDI